MNEFHGLPRTSLNDISFASHLNKNKNRYRNVLTIERTRVKLNNLINNYINANYVTPNMICTQAPLPNTFRDFWKMVWDQNVMCIVMLCKIGDKKSDIYWVENSLVNFPNSEIILKYNRDETIDNTEISVSVRMIQEQEHDFYIFRTFNLSYNDESRIVYHFQYTEWEDHSSPPDPAHIDFLINQSELYSKGQRRVIHCSAGVGRTGTFAACVVIKNNKNGNIFEIVSNLRSERCKMVQTEEQYNFIYQFLKYLNESV